MSKCAQCETKLYHFIKNILGEALVLNYDI